MCVCAWWVGGWWWCLRVLIRYLECTTNGDSKWWSISAQSCNTRVSWGTIGDQGSVSEKNHKDEETADKFMAKMLGQKLKKGYVQK